MGFLAFLSGCFGGVDGEKYVEMEPGFRLEEYFNGPIKAWGIIQDRSGNVISRFDVVMEGRWEGDNGVLEEWFTYYDSGKEQKRVWEITKKDELNYEGKAGDIIGTATGKAYGNAIQWTYEMEIPVDDSSYQLTFDDWMWEMHGGVVINRSYMKKFGVTVAELTIFMQKQDVDRETHSQ